MSAELNIELCSETGICSILRKDNSKVDLMPDEVEALRKAAGNPEAMRKIIADGDGVFAGKLEDGELKHLGEYFS